MFPFKCNSILFSNSFHNIAQKINIICLMNVLFPLILSRKITIIGNYTKFTFNEKDNDNDDYNNRDQNRSGYSI